MVFIDKLTEFADAVAATTVSGSGTTNIGSSVDLGAPDPGDPAAGSDLYLHIEVGTAITGSGTATSFQLVSDSGSTIATDGSATVHVKTDDFDVSASALTAGLRILTVKLPSGLAYQRYLGVQAVSDAALSAGTINAYLTPNPQMQRHYPDGAPTLS